MFSSGTLPEIFFKNKKTLDFRNTPRGFSETHQKILSGVLAKISSAAAPQFVQNSLQRYLQKNVSGASPNILSGIPSKILFGISPKIFWEIVNKPFFRNSSFFLSSPTFRSFLRILSKIPSRVLLSEICPESFLGLVSDSYSRTLSKDTLNISSAIPLEFILVVSSKIPSGQRRELWNKSATEQAIKKAQPFFSTPTCNRWRLDFDLFVGDNTEVKFVAPAGLVQQMQIGTLSLLLRKNLIQCLRNVPKNVHEFLKKITMVIITTMCCRNFLLTFLEWFL